LDEIKSKYAGLAQEKAFWLSIIAKLAVAGKRPINVVHLNKKSVINMI
jgi:hypothetical protein